MNSHSPTTLFLIETWILTQQPLENIDTVVFKAFLVWLCRYTWNHCLAEKEIAAVLADCITFYSIFWCIYFNFYRPQALQTTYSQAIS